VSSAQEGQYWTTAAADLRSGAATAGADAGRYQAIASDLTAIAALPDTSLTASQKAEDTADVTDINSFFGTPGLGS
jgi:hypothetical protein